MSKNNSEKKTFMEQYIYTFEKWMPESLFICFILTLLVATLAIFLTDTPVYSLDPKKMSVVSAWTKGFWSLLAFTMQMTVLLATGNAVASSPPAKKVLSAIASLPSSRVQYIILGIGVAGFFGFIHWGLGMMTAIVFGKELLVQAKKKGVLIHAPTFVATIFFGFLPSSGGISGAAVLYAATPGYLKGLVPQSYKAITPQSIPLFESVLNPQFIGLLLVCMSIAVIIALVLHPKDTSKIIEIDQDIYNEVLSAQNKITIPRNTPAQKANGAMWIMYLIGGVIFAYSINNLMKLGVTGLDLNSFNFLFLGLGMLACAHYGPEYYGKLFKQGVTDSYGFVIQFPFYAGIFGMISMTGLAIVISHFFSSISTPTTWPVICFLYSALLNIAVPSGGSKFVIEAPYIVPTTIDLGVNMGKLLQAYQMGDGTTNLIIPFFAIPYLANFKLKFNQIVPYTLPAVLLSIVVTCIYLLF